MKELPMLACLVPLFSELYFRVTWLYSAICLLQCCALHFSILHCTALKCSALHCTAMFYIVLQNYTLHSSIVYFIAALCIALKHSILH